MSDIPGSRLNLFSRLPDIKERFSSVMPRIGQSNNNDLYFFTDLYHVLVSIIPSKVYQKEI